MALNIERTENENAGVDVNALLSQIEEMKANYAKELVRIKAGYIIEKVLTEAGVKNKKAALALLDVEYDVEGFDEIVFEQLVREKVESLKVDEESSFLFEDGTGAAFKGVSPAASKEGLPSLNGFEERIKNARASGNTKEAIAIINEAAKRGVYLR